MGIEHLFLDTAGRDPLMEDAPAKPTRLKANFGTYSMDFLVEASNAGLTANQLVIALLLHRKCVMQRKTVVSLSNKDIARFNFSRWTKYRVLKRLREIGMISVVTETGRSTAVRFLWIV